MRFQRVIIFSLESRISLESRRGTRRDKFGRNELRPSPDSPQAYLGSLRHGDEAEDDEAEADTFPVLTHHLPVKTHDPPVKICIPVTCLLRSAFPCEARAADDTAHAHQKSIEASLSWFLTSPDSPEEIGTRGIEGQGGLGSVSSVCREAVSVCSVVETVEEGLPHG